MAEMVGAAMAERYQALVAEGRELVALASRCQRRLGAVPRIAGDVDVYSAERLRAALELLLAAGTGNVLLDCADPDFIDSTGPGCSSPRPSGCASATPP